MINLFSYNWQVRDDWFKWCESLPENELHAERTGGMKSIFKNLLHIVDCELLWVNYMLQEPYTYEKRDAITSLKELIEYSDSIKKVTGYFLGNWNDECEKKTIEISNKRGKKYVFSYGKIARHLISHEIHHIGQLSVWSRELGIKPVSSDLIIRQF